MKKLSELYQGEDDRIIKGIKINSKDVEQGDLFICTKGVTADRHDFILDAINHGAVAIVVSRDHIKVDKDVSIIKVEDTNLELPKLCARFFDYPDKKLKMIGVTGTDGKTSVATIIQTLLTEEKCGYIGTNGRRCYAFDKDTNNTTPDADKLYLYFNEFVDAKCKYVAMEASSEAFYRGRLENLLYDVSVITNITKEHLNIHGSFENYIACKEKLFDQTKEDGVSILNTDDDFYLEVKTKCKAKVLTYGKKEEATLKIVSFQLEKDHTEIIYQYQGKDYFISSPLLGEFNVYNLAAGLLTGLALGYKMEELLPRVKDIYVDGRLNFLKTNTKYHVMIDYAHTPNGIINLLNFVHTLDIKRSIVVLGSAGERDYLKRPLMGKTVVDNASYVIFTYEDPRSEDPKDIIEMMISEIKDRENYEIVVDRKEAIKRAIDIAKDNDMVLILGKGNETYEKLAHEVIYFNDVEEALKAVEERKRRESVRVE